MPGTPLFTEVLQVGLVVKDLEKTMQNYTDIMGVGPWEIYDLDENSLKDVKIYGKPQKLTMKVALCNIGNIQIELIQPLDHGGIYSEFLKKQGEGLHHIACAVDSFNETVSRLAKADIGILMSGVTSDGMGFAYMDTADAIGTIVEIYNIPEGVTMKPADRIVGETKSRPLLDQIVVIGLVVENVTQTMKNYREIIGFDSVEVLDLDENFLMETTVRGKPQKLTMKAGFVDIGSVKMELIQPLENSGIYPEFLKSRGEGLHHIGCTADNYEETMECLSKAGVGILQNGVTSDGAKFTYMDTANLIGLIPAIYKF